MIPDVGALGPRQADDPTETRPVILLDVEIDGSRYPVAVTDGEVLADPVVLDRARLMVAFGESFDVDGRSIAATLHGPATFVALTIMRGADRVHAFELVV